jgi:hypothetical protein
MVNENFEKNTRFKARFVIINDPAKIEGAIGSISQTSTIMDLKTYNQIPITRYHPKLKIRTLRSSRNSPYSRPRNSTEGIDTILESIDKMNLD